MPPHKDASHGDGLAILLQQVAGGAQKPQPSLGWAGQSIIPSLGIY